MKKAVAVAMIVKNEEAMLSECLETVKEADEIVICDTGSTDSTIEVAKRYTDKVYTDFEWCDHFARARNHVKSKVKSDWILSIDADELLMSPFHNVREAAERAYLAADCRCSLATSGSITSSLGYSRIRRKSGGNEPHTTS